MAHFIREVNTLTGIRAFACLWVITFHLYKDLVEGTVLYPFFSAGVNGVSLFFILSGFILSYVYSERFKTPHLFKVSRGFIENRIARIYPLHFVTLLFVALMIFLNVFPSDNFTVEAFIQNLFLTQGWGIFDLSSFSYNHVSWSVSVEWFWYLLFPGFVFLVNCLSRVWVVILAIVFSFLSFTIFLDGGTYLKPFLGFLCWDQGGPFYCGTLIIYEGMFFLLGLCLYSIFKDHPESYVWDWGCLAAFVMLFFLFALPWDPADFLWELSYRCLFFPYGLLIVSLYKTKGVFLKIFGNPLMVYLGEISFALYMIHRFLIATILALVPEIMTYYVQVFAILILLPVAGGIYTFIEIPSRSFLRELFHTPWAFVERSLRKKAIS
jgi:peptidoglycan/LPS O-acetylase OafA/YrhL